MTTCVGVPCKTCMLCIRRQLVHTIRVRNLLPSLLGLPLPTDVLLLICAFASQDASIKHVRRAHNMSYQHYNYSFRFERVELDLI